MASLPKADYNGLTMSNTVKTTLSTKGQVVLPKPIRDALNLTNGSELVVEVHDGTVVMRPVRRTTVDDVVGMLQWNGEPKSLEDMDAAIAAGARESR